MASRAGSTYEWLLSPLTPSTFAASHYERSVCVVSRESPAYYCHLLSLDDLDRLLGSRSLRHPAFNIVKADQKILRSEYANDEGDVDPSRAAHLFARGATLIFTHLHRRLPALSDLCVALSDEMSSVVQANVYLTPHGSRGFKPHWDTHDVFVLQIVGRKTWSIYDERHKLPLRGQQFNKEAPGPLTQSFELGPGDMTYIPRGVMHSAESAQGVSLHITVGLMAFTWSDLLIEGIGRAALTDASLRQNLPLGFASEQFSTADRETLYAEMLKRLWEYMHSGAAVAFQGLGTELTSRQISYGGSDLIRQCAQLDRITLDSAIVQRANVHWEFDEAGADVVILAGTKRIAMPKVLTEALHFIQSSERFSGR